MHLYTRITYIICIRVYIHYTLYIMYIYTLYCFASQVLFFSGRDVLLVDSGGHRGSIKGPELEYNGLERVWNEKKKKHTLAGSCTARTDRRQGINVCSHDTAASPAWSRVRCVIQLLRYYHTNRVYVVVYLRIYVTYITLNVYGHAVRGTQYILLWSRRDFTFDLRADDVCECSRYCNIVIIILGRYTYVDPCPAPRRRVRCENDRTKTS